MFRDQKKDSAMDFIKVRSRLRDLSGLKLDEIQFGNGTNKWAGLYLDETGTAGKAAESGEEEEFTIGGIYVVGPPGIKRWEAFESELGKIPNPSTAKNKNKAKKENRPKYINRLYKFIDNENEQNSIFIHPFEEGNDYFFIKTIKLTTYIKEKDEIKAMDELHKPMLEKLIGELFLGVILPLLEKKGEIKIGPVFSIRYGTCTKHPKKEKAARWKERTGAHFREAPRKPGQIDSFLLPSNLINQETLSNRYRRNIVNCAGFTNTEFKAFQHIADAILDEYKDPKIKGIQAGLDQYPGISEEYYGENDSLSHFVDANKCFYEYNDDEKYFRALDAITRDEAWESVEEVIKIYKQSPNIYSLFLLWHTQIIKAYNNQSPNTARAYICERLSKGLHQKISTTPKENFYKLCRLMNLK